jgi:small subunit ribosomal protein S6
LLCILKTGFDIETSEQIIANIDNAIKNLGGTILNANKIGRKKLAYDINKNRDAFYVNFDIEIAAQKITELKRYLKLNESVLRNFVTIKKELKVKVAS